MECTCVQYVSALRPPKSSHRTVNGSKTRTMNHDSGGPTEGRRRVCSLTHQSSAAAHRHDIPRRSLQDPFTGSQLNWSVEKELKRRRRQAGFDQSYGELKKSDSDSDPESGESTDADENEWKQVRKRIWT